jgi:D-alanine-D-alanine ligase
MLKPRTVLLVGDTVDDGGVGARSWFDEDKPTHSEIADLAGWFTEAGYRVDVSESVRHFVEAPPGGDGVVVFPLWRGGASRNRTAIVPAVCEARGLAYVGGDALVQTLCQDKSISKLCLRSAGFHVPGEWVVRAVRELATFRPSLRLRAPFVVKPLYSAASIGVTPASLCESDAPATQRAAELLADGLGPVVCEEFISGEEVSLCFVEEAGEVVRKSVAAFRGADGRCPFLGRLCTFDDKLSANPPWRIVALENTISDDIWSMAEALTRSLGKVDYMRIDGRIENGRFVVIELTPDIHLGLTSCFLGSFNAAGTPPPVVLDHLVTASLRNWGEAESVAWR